jgi:hypothetical protein
VLSRDVEDNLIVYPNPTSDKININREVDVRIINTIGDVVIQENNISVLDVSYLSPGMYTIQIIYKNKSITKQIIKK